jgi:Cys-tRNA(Pro)/Cys-tRNA(Cys) deacylase
MDVKTNPMRHLDKLGIPYKVNCYGDAALGGMEVAEALGEGPSEAFKTLVTQSKEKAYYVFVVPVTGELDLKKAAASVGEKSVSMIKSADLLSVTGYVHGGCSPMCIKRPMKVVVDSSANDHGRFYVSAGKIGYQIEMSPSDILKAIPGVRFADIKKPSDRQHRICTDGAISHACHRTSILTATARTKAVPGMGTAWNASNSIKAKGTRSRSV